MGTFIRFTMLTAALMGTAAPVLADPFTVDQAASVFAVVTHKGGLAKGFAHHHFVASPTYSAKIDMPAAGATGGTMQFSVATKDLQIDTDVRKVWFERLKALAVLEEAFADVSEGDRTKIKEAMVADDQLDIAKFPEVKAEVKGLKEAAGKVGSLATTHTADVAMTIHGKTVTKAVPLAVAVNGTTLKVEGAAVFLFSEFGIEPYSAMLGAVKVTDDFHVYVNVTAAKGS